MNCMRVGGKTGMLAYDMMAVVWTYDMLSQVGAVAVTPKSRMHIGEVRELPVQCKD